jgi:hypothetical protein
MEEGCVTTASPREAFDRNVVLLGVSTSFSLGCAGLITMSLTDEAWPGPSLPMGGVVTALTTLGAIVWNGIKVRGRHILSEFSFCVQGRDIEAV